MAQMPFMIAYVFLASPYLRRWLDQVLVAMRPLVELDDAQFAQLLEQAATRNRKTQQRFTTGYVLVSFLILGAWDEQFPATSAYWLVSLGIVSVLIGQLIAMVPLFARQLINTLLPLSTQYNVFNPLPLHSIADFSLRVTLVLIGAIVGGELLVPVDEALGLLHLSINGALVLFALALHFFMIWGAHLLMLGRKEEELEAVAARLETSYEAMQAQLDEGALVSEELEYTISALLALERRLDGAPEWPQSPAIVIELLVSTTLPTALALSKKLVSEIADVAQTGM